MDATTATDILVALGSEIPAELATRQINGFSRGVRQYKDPNLENYLKAPMLETCTVAIQAALSAAWFPRATIRPNQVEDAGANHIIALGEAIMRAYYAAQEAANVEKK